MADVPQSAVRAVIRASAGALGVWNPALEELLLMIAAHESHMGKYTRQVGGPALGWWQMEPATHDDTLKIVVPRRPHWAPLLRIFSTPRGLVPEALAHSLSYAAAMAALQATRFSDVPTRADDIKAMAAWCKRRWNGPGKATADDYERAYRARVL